MDYILMGFGIVVGIVLGFFFVVFMLGVLKSILSYVIDYFERKDMEEIKRNNRNVKRQIKKRRG